MPIVKIESGSSIMHIIKTTVNLIHTYKEQSNIYINDLRTLLKSSTCNITTYENIPLVGLSEIKDARNNKQSYKYDSSWRLNSILDYQGNTLKKIIYNYKK